MGRINELLIVGITGLALGLFFVIKPKKVIELFWHAFITFRLPESDRPQDEHGQQVLLRKYMTSLHGPEKNITGCGIIFIVVFGLMCMGLGGMFLFAYFNP